MHGVSGLLMALLFTAISAYASAQQGRIDNIGNAGGIVIGGERLAGGYVTKLISEDSESVSGVTVTSEATTTTTNFAIFAHDPTAPTQVPRLGLDYFLIDGLSIGGSFMYVHQSADRKSKTTAEGPGVPSQTMETDTELPTESLLVVHPRIGYAIAFNEIVGLWPRVGFSYASLRVESEQEPQPGITVTRTTTINVTDLTLEGLLFVSPFSNFALVGGPFADIGLGGSAEVKVEQTGAPDQEEQETDAKITAYGFMLGVAGYFDTQ